MEGMEGYLVRVDVTGEGRVEVGEAVFEGLGGGVDLVGVNDVLVGLHLNKIKKSILGGDRTHNPQIRSLMRCPLRHEDVNSEVLATSSFRAQLTKDSPSACRSCLCPRTHSSAHASKGVSLSLCQVRPTTRCIGAQRSASVFIFIIAFK